MTRRLTALKAKANFLALLDEVADGEEIEITKHGRTIAKLVPARGPTALKSAFEGIAVTAADDQLFSTGVDWDLR
jgi:prevent-host-death family protein